MKKVQYRTDNKKLLLWAYIAFLALIITSLIINILNTKNIMNMYILFAVFGGAIILYSLFYIIFLNKNKQPLKLEDNNLAFYVSFNKNNTKLKVTSLIIDILMLPALVVAATYYIYNMNNKGKLVIIASFLTLSICVGIALQAGSPVAFGLANSSEYSVWHHYNKKLPTQSEKGIKEYWVLITR